MTDLVTRLQRLSGSNPVARVILLPEDWPEIERLIADADRHRWMRDASGCNDLSEAIDNARKKDETQ